MSRGKSLSVKKFIPPAGGHAFFSLVIIVAGSAVSDLHTTEVHADFHALYNAHSFFDISLPIPSPSTLLLTKKSSKGLGEHCELSQRSPTSQRILCIVSSTIPPEKMRFHVPKVSMWLRLELGGQLPDGHCHSF